MIAAMDAPDEVLGALAEFDRRFAAGRPDALAALFSPDARLLLLHREAIEGRPAIREHWARVFAAWDPGAWQAERLIVDVHGDRAYAVSTYSETLVDRAGRRSQAIRGRLVLFLRRQTGGDWSVDVALNSHSRPIEWAEPAADE